MILSNEVKKAIAKNQYYGEESFIQDANQWIKAIKEGRVICSVISVAKSGMSRKLRFLSFESSVNEGRSWYRQYYSMMQVLGFKWNQKDYCITVGGCGMNMIFHTNYTIMHQLKSMGFITYEECESLAQQTPTTI
jgi:hypothetical protein